MPRNVASVVVPLPTTATKQNWFLDVGQSLRSAGRAVGGQEQHHCSSQRDSVHAELAQAPHSAEDLADA